jgi:hypothetical protein
MRIERYDHRCAIGRVGVPGRSRNDRLVAPMHAIEDADGEEEGTGQGRKVADGVKDLHLAMNDKIRMTNVEGIPKSECGMIPHLVIPLSFVIRASSFAQLRCAMLRASAIPQAASVFF